jgi:hypothetical protein
MITFTIVAIIGLIISFIIIKKWIKWNLLRKSEEVKFDEETGEIKLPFKHIKFKDEYWLGSHLIEKDKE